MLQIFKKEICIMKDKKRKENQDRIREKMKDKKKTKKNKRMKINGFADFATFIIKKSNFK